MDTQLSAGRAGQAGRAGRSAAILVCAFFGLGAATALAQTQQQPPPDAVRLIVPPVTVTATKEPADAQTLPLSVTAVSKDTISSDGIDIISDAGIYAPNTYFSEFSARKLSFPHFRGISSGPGNPAITTYIDGVPQLHTNTSSIDLLDVDQVELVRGPQSALF